MILLVDDEAARMASHVDELELSGYRVAQATTVAELRLFIQGSETPDAVLLDVMMPPGDLANARDGLRTGIALLDEIRKRWPEVPVIVLTNVSDTGILSAAEQSGARVVHKINALPRDLPELVRSIAGAPREASS